MQPIETTRPHCVDPETLAAWVDGGLAAPEAAEVEAHLSTCARCQAVLAALSATETAVGGVGGVGVVLPFWSRRPVQWAAAALAAAASITLWTMNRPEFKPAPLPTPAPESVIVQAPPSPSTSAPSELRRTSPAPPASSTPSTPRRPTVTGPAPTAPSAAPAPAPLPLPAPATPPPPPVNPATMVTAARQEQVAFSPMAELMVQRQPFEVTSASDQNAPLAIDGLVPSAAGRGGAGRGMAGNVSAGLARRPQVRWRVTAAAVERSIDSGRTWERLEMDAPITLNAGSAPFQNVCWFVGQDGVIFRTTNGTSFERMTPPDKVHLLVIVATDALRAMVTAADGRVFETTDGGVTWTVRK